MRIKNLFPDHKAEGEVIAEWGGAKLIKRLALVVNREADMRPSGHFLAVFSMEGREDGDGAGGAGMSLCLFGHGKFKNMAMVPPPPLPA